MPDRQAVAAVLTVTGDRLPPLQSDISARRFEADLDARLSGLSTDLASALEAVGQLTAERRAKLEGVAAEARTGRDAVNAGKLVDAWAAYTRAAGRINDVCLDCTHGGFA